jgi:hypothetical protein
MDMPAASGHRTGIIPAQGFPSLLRKSISAHGIFLALIAVYYAGFLTLIRLRPDLNPTSFFDLVFGFSVFSMPLMIFAVFFLRLFHVAKHVKPERPLPVLTRDIGRFFAHPGRMAQGLPMVFVMVMFMYVFVELKASIPMLNPYSWDAAFAQADRTLHFGSHPWEWLQPVFGYAPLTFLISVNYSIWFMVMWIVWMYFAFLDGASEIRTRFFLTFFTAWIAGGGIMAIWFSSVGPCFYGRFGLAPDPYADLLTYLRAANEVLPIWALPVQDMLWEGFKGDSLVEGISAMPSMHNGTALLFVLAAFRVNRTMGWILAVHGAFIFIGSVALAWHYAVDGYVAAGLILVLWWAMAPVARWWHGRAAQAEFATALESGA